MKGKVVGRGTVSVPRSGSAHATIKLSKAAARSVHRAKRVTFTISAGGLTRTLRAS